jgi:hypothetical protein
MLIEEVPNDLDVMAAIEGLECEWTIALVWEYSKRGIPGDPMRRETYDSKYASAQRISRVQGLGSLPIARGPGSPRRKLY